MKRILAVLLLSATALWAQNPVVEGLMRGIEAGRMVREAQAAKELAELMRLESERTRRLIEEQDRLLRERQQSERKQQVPPDREDPVDAEIEELSKFVRIISARYPDFDKYADEVVRLVEALNTKKLSGAERLEMLYLTAKYSTYSHSPDAEPANGRQSAPAPR